MSQPTDTTPQLADAVIEIAADRWSRVIAGEHLDQTDRRILVTTMNGHRGFTTIVLAALDRSTSPRQMLERADRERLRFIVGMSLSGQPVLGKPAQVQTDYDRLVELAAAATADGVADRDRVGVLLAAGVLAWWAGMSPDLVLAPIDEVCSIKPQDSLGRQLQTAALATKRVLATLEDQSL